VSAGAFGDHKPARDLWLSPGHSIAAEGVLIPIKTLENGKTVAQHQLSTVEYWHVELDQHDIILAEGLPAESYLDTGNRTAFFNGGAFMEAHPDFQPKHWAETCAPLVFDGPEVVRTKALLLERARGFGHLTTLEPDLHVIADGERIEPMQLGAMRFAFALPVGRKDIWLTSRTCIPAHTLADYADTRLLGVCIRRLQIDGETITLDDASLDNPGWSHLETRPDIEDKRWTRGRAALPAETRLVVIDLAGNGCYWREPRDNVVALFG
jgi:Hint domain-containing protein